MQAQRPVSPVAVPLVILGIVFAVFGGLATILSALAVLTFHNWAWAVFGLPGLIVAGVGVALLVVGRRALRTS